LPVNKRRFNKEGEIKKLDLTGKICPMTFVYTKLAIEELNKGDIIEVLVDYPPAVENVPESCKRQSLAELLEITDIDSHKKSWRLKLKKL